MFLLANDKTAVRTFITPRPQPLFV